MTEVVADEEFDRLLAESVGPYLRIYVTVRLSERGDDARLAQALAELYAGLIATDAFVYAGERQGFQARLYGIVDRALPYVGRPALRGPADPEAQARARRFVALVDREWHGGYDDYVRALRALPPREREALLLRDFHAASMHEVGQRLGLSKEAARAFVNDVRARARVEPSR